MKNSILFIVILAIAGAFTGCAGLSIAVKTDYGTISRNSDGKTTIELDASKRRCLTARMRIDTRQKREAIDSVTRDNPTAASRTLARLLYAKHKELFPSLEAARSSIRKRRGADGSGMRESMKSRKADFQDRSDKRTSLPPSLAVPSVPHIIGAGTVAILCDVHVPYHDARALKTALAHMDIEKPNTILLGGDTIDFFAISRYEKDPSKRDLLGEINGTKQFLHHLNERYPKTKIVYMAGNHDERWRSYVWQKAPELWNLPQMRLESLLDLDKLKIDFVTDRRAVMLGRCAFYHGHELPTGVAAPVNPARGLFLRLLSTGACGHHHRTSEHVERTADGRFITCWSIGSLCELQPEYAPVNKWNHGFAVVRVKKDGQFHFKNYRIHEGKVL